MQKRAGYGEVYVCRAWPAAGVADAQSSYCDLPLELNETMVADCRVPADGIAERPGLVCADHDGLAGLDIEEASVADATATLNAGSNEMHRQ
jgi:hypothetical protein